jgi:hypothetical protein
VHPHLAGLPALRPVQQLVQRLCYAEHV